MKKIYISLLLLSYTLFCLADPIDKKKAAKIAEEFYKQQVQQESEKSRSRSTKKTKFQLDYVCKDESKDNKRAKNKKQDNNNLYYVFNADKEQGFVIVAGDDKAGEVLAYSSSGNFSHSDMPDNLKYWMDSYKDAIKAIVNDEVRFNLNPGRKNTNETYSPKILPLLGKEGIKWNQLAPYNGACPLDSRTQKTSVTGCVATAISQIMRYHKYPKQASGTTHSYTSKTLNMPLTVKFDVAYDWNNMLPEYTNGNYTKTQADAVAMLMYHVGVAVDMDYSSNDSGTDTGFAKEALVKHFGYDKSLDYLKRNVFSPKEWYSIIKKELNEKRPLIYDGESKGGGHAFVCDGYDSNDLFHINWGWGGMSDGYFDLSILEPATQGTGGGSGGYSSGQGILIGIQPKPTNSSSEPNYRFTYNNISTATYPNNQPANKFPRNDYFYLNLDFSNISSLDYNGEFVISLKNANTEESIYTDTTNFNLRKNASIKGGALPIQIKPTVANGNYKLSFKMKDPNSVNQYIVALPDDEAFRDIDVEITDNHIEFKYNKVEPKLELIGEIEIDGGQLYSNRNSLFTVNLKNSGNAVFRSRIELVLNTMQGKKVTTLDYASLGIEVGETKTLTFKGRTNEAPGQYRLEVMYASPNNESGNVNNTIEGGKQINLLPKPATGNLEFSNLEFKKKTPHGEKFLISFDAKNKGEFCAEEIVANFFKQEPENTSSSYSHHQTMEQAFTIDNHDSTTISFELETESLKVGTKLLVQFKYNSNFIELETYEKKYSNSEELFLVSRNQFTFEIIAPDKPLLSCTLESLDDITIADDSKLYLNLPVNNSGAQYNEKIKVQFLDKLYVPMATVEEAGTIDNEEKTIHFKDNDATRALLPGTYTMNMLYKKAGEFILMDGNYIYLEIKIPEAKLSIDNTSPQAELKFNLTQQFEYNAKISNMGGAFDEDIYLDIIPTEKLSAKGQETLTITTKLNVARTAVGTAPFKVDLEDSKFKVGDYTLQLKQRNKTAPTTRTRNNQDEFSNIGTPIKLRILKADGTVGLISNKADKASLKIQQYADNLVIELPKESETLYIYDLTGRLLSKNVLRSKQTEFVYKTSSSNSGIYIIVAEGKYGKIVEKTFVK